MHVALHEEGENAPKTPILEVFLGQRVVLVTLQPRVVYPFHLRMALQPAGQLQRVEVGSLGTQGERFQSLEQQEGVKWAVHRPHIAQPLYPTKGSEGDVAVGRALPEGLPEVQAVVPFRGFAEHWELAVAPVVVTPVDNHAPHRGAVATDPLGSRVQDHVGSPLDRVEDVTTLTERVVHDQRDVMLACHGGDRFEIGHVVFRVPDGLQVDRLGSPVDQRGNAIHVVPVGKAYLNAQPCERHLKLVVGTTVKEGGGDDIVARGGDGMDRDKLRGVPRGGGHGGNAPFQRSHPLFEHLGGGVLQTGVYIPELF